MKEKKIAVIGANSFIATYVIKELAKHNYQLHLYGRREVSVSSRTAFSYFSHPDKPVDYEELHSFDTIIYTAGAGTHAPAGNDMIYHVNAFLPISLIQYLQDKEYKGHVITFGSYFEIGNSPIEKFYTEEEYVTNSNIVPNNYCLSKRLLTQYISQKINELSFHLTHFVLPNMYGVGEKATRIIPYLVESLKNKNPINLSSGTQKRQYLHARDAAVIVEKAVVQPVTGIYNLGSTDVLSIRELVQIVADEVPDKEGVEINFGNITKRDAGMPFLAIDFKKAEKDLSWKPAVSLLAGIREYF